MDKVMASTSTTTLLAEPTASGSQKILEEHSKKTDYGGNANAVKMQQLEKDLQMLCRLHAEDREFYAVERTSMLEVMNDLEQQLDILSTGKQAVEEELAQTEARVIRAEQEATSAKRALDDSSSIHAVNNSISFEVKAKMKELEVQNESLQAELEAWKHRARNAEGHAERATRLSENLEAAQQRVSQLEAQIEARRQETAEERASLKNEITRWKDQVIILTEKVDLQRQYMMRSGFEKAMASHTHNHTPLANVTNNI
mmetsp:Transcript_16073/g.31085  ORF Transcript_16073/g.31085 Transcript_16073/m.31085 type:complete len:257 (+) Transcript_16073:155-925(+)|eukprot:CAMPEP_0171521870 /NCGR_PEP_ID=MMETSP0959-20130129/7397_1 /TAXON_ID=87120 /ORGANISM="Aurantiochytrium limacinum, Strain ATCCMYA-1381" /LENGTH=256 /DNA_ID=CAMNT_0012061869 /DNA_START=65 /DNA_END=835 /DNA_ORIENTATION=-